MINDDDEVVIDLEYTVAADESIDFELEGVITDSIGQTLTVTLTEVYAIGADTGIIAGLTGDSLPALSGNFATVDGSEINVSFDKGDADEAKPGAEDVLVGTLNLKATSDYTINELTVTATTTGSGVNDIVKDLELDGKSFDSEIGGVFKFEDISLDAGVETMLDLTLELEDEVALNGSSIEFNITIVEVEDEENDELFNAGSTPDLDSVLSSNSFDEKSIDVETASYKLTQSKVSLRELVLGNGLEVVLYQGKLNIGDADTVTLRDIVFTGSISSTGSYDLEDIIDSATLNIGGVTDSADVETGTLEFNSANIEVAAGSDNVEVLLTAILKDNDSVNNGDTISFNTSAALIVAEDSDAEDLVSGAGVVNPASSATVVKLNERGTFAIAVVNDGENEDDVEDVVLAGTNSVTLAEVVFEAEEEDMDVKELRFTLSGAFDDSVKNVRLMDGSTVIADGATVTLSGANTVIEFEDFVIEDSGEEIDATLVADLNIITTEGGVVSATAGDIIVLALTASDMDIEGANSDDTITADLSENENSDAVSIVPVLVTASVASTNDQFSDEEEQAFVSIDLDMGENDLDSDDVVLTTIEFSTASGAALFNNPNAFVKIDNTEVTYTVSGSIMTITAEGDLNDGDEILFSIDATADASRVKIIENGISFTVDGSPYSANTGDDELDLGRYTTDQDNN